MSGPEERLPPGFESLEPFVASWVVADSNARLHLRHQATAEARSSFYQAAQPLLEAALQHLDSQPLDAMDPASSRLMGLMLSLAHVAKAVEHYGPDEAAHASHLQEVTIVRTISTDPAGG